MTASNNNKLDLSLYLELINNSNDMIFILNMKSMKYEFINQTACDKLGYTFDELQALGVEGIRKSLPDNSTFSEHINELKQSEKGLTDYAILVCKDGSEIFIEANVRIINRDKNDYDIAIVRDITERVEYIKTIEFNNRQTQNYLDVAKVLIMALDKDKIVTMINQEGANILGYTKEEIVGKNWFEHFVPKDKQEVIDNIFEDILEQKDEHNGYENHVLSKNGKTPLIRWRNSILADDEGTVIGILASGVDITMLKAQQLKSVHQAQIIEQINDAVVTTDFDNNIVSWNLGAQKMLGYSANEVIGKNIFMFHYKEDMPFIHNSVETLIRTGSLSKDWYMVRKDKEIIYASLSLSLLKDENGIPLNIIAYGHDITEHKKAQDEIKNINENLQKEVDLQLKKLREQDSILIEQSKLAQMGDMLNMIAHQWRQPLNSISASSINLSLKNELDMLDKETIEKTSKFIQQQTQNMSKIIDDFMEFNKPDTNKEFLLFEPVNGVAKIISSQLTSRAIKLEINIDKEIKVYHNPKNIEHVLLNLVVNSRDAFEDRKDIEDKKIKIFTTDNEDYVTLSVEDNAGGIPEDIINKIFNPYFTTKEQGKGTGIGLYMSKRMVENIDGCTIDVEVINDSTLFRIQFGKVNNFGYVHVNS